MSGPSAEQPVRPDRASRQPSMLEQLDEIMERVKAAGPFPSLVRIAPDVWSVARRDQDLNRPLLAPVPSVLTVPLVVDDDLPAGQWRVEMSDGTERSSEDSTRPGALPEEDETE